MTIYVFGASADSLAGLPHSAGDETAGMQGSPALTAVRVKADSPEALRQASQHIADLVGKEHIISEQGECLQSALVHQLKVRGLHIATAESITGGMLSKMITDVSGASEVFECGVCSYSNRIKHGILGVSEQTLREYTEYSSRTAAEMAEGVKRISGADIGLSTTGLAGPGGGTDEKPVGLVYVGVSMPDSTRTYRLLLDEDGTKSRDDIRQCAAANALFLVLKALDIPQ